MQTKTKTKQETVKIGKRTKDVSTVKLGGKDPEHVQQFNYLVQLYKETKNSTEQTKKSCF